jgi:radical SAM protein with 4Fe4S-binding SPASM domain
MSVEQFRMICEQIRFYTDYIYLHVQGEPLLHPQFSEILAITDELHLIVQLVTNGTLIDRHLDTLSSSPSLRQISVSLQSLVNSGKYKDSTEALKLFEHLKSLSKHGKIVQLRYWMYNEQSFTAFVNDCLQYFGVEIQSLSPRKKRYTTATENIYFSLDYPFIWPSDPQTSRIGGTCYGTREMLGILSDGTLVPCCLDHQGAISFGNVFESDIATLLDHPRLTKMRSGFKNHKIVEPFCQQCGYRQRFD